MPVPTAGQPTLVLDLQCVGQPVVEAAKNLPSCSASGHERPHRLGHVGGGHVHGEGHEVAVEGQDDLLGDGHAGLVLGLGRRGPEVGGHHHRGQLEQGRLGRRLLGEHVEAGPCTMP